MYIICVAYIRFLPMRRSCTVCFPRVAAAAATTAAPTTMTPTTAAANGCTDACAYASDGSCDDGGDASVTSWCRLGTDCGDCGPRRINGTTVADCARFSAQRCHRYAECSYNGAAAVCEDAPPEVFVNCSRLQWPVSGHCVSLLRALSPDFDALSCAPQVAGSMPSHAGSVAAARGPWACSE